MASLRGHFLLASSSLLDPNFAQTVVLLLKHDESGALGLIVNAPLDVSVSEAIGEQVPAARGIDAPLFRGGPCRGPIMTLCGTAVADAEEVMPGVHFSDDSDTIVEVMTGGSTQVRYVINYAGWVTDQLESELAEGSWDVIPAAPQDVFAEPSTLWSRLMARAKLLRHVRPEQISDRPELN